MYHNFVKVAASTHNVKVAACMENAGEIFLLICEAEKKMVEIVCFPELSITAYTCGDMFFNSALIDESQKSLAFLLEKTKTFDIISIVGMPISIDNKMFNCAVVFQKGKILGVVPKRYLPNNNEFYEHRWFSSALESDKREIRLLEQDCPFGGETIFCSQYFNFSVEICEDLWAVVPPSSFQALGGSHIIFNLSASNELVGKNRYRKNLIEQQSGRCNAGYVYASSGFGESSTDLLFASSAIIAENGSILAESNRFSMNNQLIISEIDIEKIKRERLKNASFKANNIPTNNFNRPSFEINHNKKITLCRKIDKHPFLPCARDMEKDYSDIFNIQSNALAVRLTHANIKKAVIGISGGLDSTLALLVTKNAFDRLKIPRSNIIGITMPGFGTTTRTKNNSKELMKRAKVSSMEISIEKSVKQHFDDIKHSITSHDTTFENSQARERTQILMDIANKENAIVVGTGDMSELALGWCTYNGDHISMYAVNTGVPKTLVKHLIGWLSKKNEDKKISEILDDILNTPISPELLPNLDNLITQKTEDIIGPYELHDFFLYYFVRFGFSAEKILFLSEIAFKSQYDTAEIKKWLQIFIKRFFTQQFKRSCMPDGVKVGSINLSPRGDWRMPSDADFKDFLLK